MAETLNISTILNHLAWLQYQIGRDVNRDRVLDGALLTLNAAAMLQARFVMPMEQETDQIPDADITKAAKLIDDFFWRVRELTDAAADLVAADKPRRLAACRSTLLDEIAKVLKKAPKLLKLSTPIPVRAPSLERSKGFDGLVQDWSQRQISRTPIDLGPARFDVEAGPHAGLLKALAGVLVVNHSAVMQQCEPEVAAAIRDTAVRNLEFDIGETAREQDGKAKKRWRALGKFFSSQLRRS